MTIDRSTKHQGLPLSALGKEHLTLLLLVHGGVHSVVKLFPLFAIVPGDGLVVNRINMDRSEANLSFNCRADRFVLATCISTQKFEARHSNDPCGDVNSSLIRFSP